MKVRALLVGALLWCVSFSVAFAQCGGQAASGYACGNGAASQGFASFYPLSTLLDRGIGSGQGTILNRTNTGWVATIAPTLGVAGTSQGTLGFAGATSGTATITAQAVAGSPTIALPNASGTLADGASSPLVLNATTGNLTCPTCVTSSGGGGITGVSPVNVSAAGAVSLQGATGSIVAGAGGSGSSFTPTPTLGVAGSAVGSIAFANATSGTVTIQPATGALGTAVATLPAGTYNLVGDSLSQILSNKTIDTAASNTVKINGNTLSASAGTATVTVPAATDTLVARATVDTLTNKTLNCANNTCTVRIGSDVTGLGTGVAAALGTNIGSAGAPVVLNGALGTPSSGVLTNATGLPVGTGIFGFGTGIATALGINVGSPGAPVLFNGAGGTPGSLTLTNATGLPFGGLASSAVATAAQYLAGTASTLVPANVAYTSETTTTFGATTTFDFSTFINTAVTLTGNITTMSVANVKAGQAGTITFIQDATGGRTTVWNSVFKFSGGVTPTLSSGANAVDVLSYSCRTTTFCVASMLNNVQ